MLQIGPALFYYKLGQTLLQIGAALLLQIRASVVTNWGSYYKLGQPLLQNRAAITNSGKTHYKLEQLLQIKAIITNWGITGIDYDQYFVSQANFFEESKVSSYEELKSRIAEYETETILK